MVNHPLNQMRGHREGMAELHVASVRGRSAVVHSQSHSPLRLLTPRAGGESVWAYASSFGGGLVAGDLNAIEIKLDPDARCFFTTQSATKVYKTCGGKSARQQLCAQVSDGALLVLAPDPVQAFANSRFEQRQQFYLTASANLALVDWMSSGRSARDERWAFECYSTRNEIYRENKLILSDALELKTGAGLSRFVSGNLDCLATLILTGPALAMESQAILQKVNGTPIDPQAGLFLAASPIPGGVILRLAGRSVETVGRRIAEELSFVRNLLGDNPWARKW